MEHSESCNKRYDACVGSNIWIPMCAGIVVKSQQKTKEEDYNPFVHHMKVKIDKASYCRTEFNTCNAYYVTAAAKAACQQRHNACSKSIKGTWVDMCSDFYVVHSHNQ